MNEIKLIEKEYLKTRPVIKAGDIIKVSLKIVEGGKERIQNFEGIVICKKHRGLKETFTVRKVFSGVGIERTFFLHSPQIEEIKILSHRKVRRAKLYYLRQTKKKSKQIKKLLSF